MPVSRPRLAVAAPSKGARATVKARSASPAIGESDNFPIVAIGASAGGLDACRKLLDALPAETGMAFIVVQHLDPHHESMMVELLATHTAMTVLQAADGMPIKREHVYVIPPGTYLTVHLGTLSLAAPQARHGARLPFDFLLHTLADDCGSRAVCVVLSGTGADGSLGLRSIKEKGGLVIAQDPEEAGYDGMPHSAIGTGRVDHVLSVVDIPALLIGYRNTLGRGEAPMTPASNADAVAVLPGIIELLSHAGHDFSLYKQGTLKRRIERRMALASIEATDASRYLEVLRGDNDELDLLAKDLLINVTSFFRDAEIFDSLATQIIPDLVRKHPLDRPLRVWIAGCSTGEEAYSLAMLFLEQIAAEKRHIKLQVFASDADPDAIVSAREGLYPKAIEATVSAARLARFFSKEGDLYKVSPEVRATVVFTVQDVLSDPPFSRLDLVSCRNLLIYLGPEAQAKVISLFHFSLRQGGILLLGSTETAGDIDGRFEVVSKSERIYRAIGRSRLHDLGVAKVTEPGRMMARFGQAQAPARQEALADLCLRLVVESHAPAAVLINARHEWLYASGPTHRYLRVPQGHPTHDLLAMAPGALRTKLRSAIHQAAHTTTPVIVPGAEYEHDGSTVPFDIDVQSVSADGEKLMLVCFVDRPARFQATAHAGPLPESARIAELERELDATRTELQGAIHNLELSGEEQKAINEEALSVNEEFQSTNEELLTSKEELQSLNEELTALNAQLQETLDRQRITANDLQNILYSADLATLFLDKDLNIRFFTPATRSLFNVIATDVGRPLADLTSLSADRDLTADARGVLLNLTPMEREIETQSDKWFVRRILPYRTHDNTVEGVVITFTDISERKAIRKALEQAKLEAEQANIAKSRFLAAASHDLRQPLQTMTLLQALLARSVEGEKALKHVTRLGETLAAMAGMLNTLLDINQIEAGIVRAEPVSFPIHEMLQRLRDEFTYHAQAKRLRLRVVDSSLFVHSDPRLLEQMLRNLLSNALKYTKQGKILLGCRRRDGITSIEIWDTGIGIPDSELKTIFDEYHQLDNGARERSRGLGLGLSIVQRLVKLLDHRIHVQSRLGKGSLFAIEVAVPSDGRPSAAERAASAKLPAAQVHSACGASILVVEDDPDVRELLELLLEAEGYRVMSAEDGHVALERVANASFIPSLVIADYNLPKGMHGLQLAARLREKLGHSVPVVIMTGDISAATLRDIDRQHCAQLNKPVKLKEIVQIIERLLSLPPGAAFHPAEPAAAPLSASTSIVHVVDDDRDIREGFQTLLGSAGYKAEAHESCEAFLKAYRSGSGGCLLVDAYLPGMGGLDLLRRLREAGDRLPAIMITGNSDVPMAVEAMKIGASDFLEKPVSGPELLATVERALEQSRDADKAQAWRSNAASQIAGLTARERQIMDLVLAGHPSKNIAADLGISQRTVENHRASIMKKTGCTSLPSLARLAMTASANA